MICETTRDAIRDAGDGDWPAAALTHVATCEDCAAFVVERALHVAPAVVIPPTFAADVARRARLAPEPAARRSSGQTVGLSAAALLLVAGLAWYAAADGTSAMLPVALLLLACGEAIVLAAWALIHTPSDAATQRS